MVCLLQDRVTKLAEPHSVLGLGFVWSMIQNYEAENLNVELAGSAVPQLPLLPFTVFG